MGHTEGLLFVFFLFSSVCLYQLYIYYKEHKLVSYVRECLSTSTEHFASRAKSQLEPPVLFNNDEFNTMSDIMSQFKYWIKNVFWNRSFPANPKSVSLTSEMFFMFYLFVFLSDHYCDENFNGHVMHTVISHKSDAYGIEYLCQFTDYGLAFLKFYYVVSLFCEKDKCACKLISHKSSVLKELLQERKITLYSGSLY